MRPTTEPAASAFSVGVAVFTIFSFEIGAAFTKGLFAGALVGLVMMHEALSGRQWTAILCIVAATGGSNLLEGIGREKPLSAGNAAE